MDAIGRGPWLPLLAVGLMLLEWGLLRLRRRQGYDWRESAASVVIAVGHRITGAISAGVLVAAFAWAYEQRIATVPLDAVWGWLALFLASEFAYYWQHRIAHTSRWFWASHRVHHSATQFNLSMAPRLGWTTTVTGAWLFFLPLPWLGFDPRAVAAMLALNLVYQFFLHTELVPSLGWLEQVFNTPARHRVHHASNGDYLDRNFGGILIVFDRLFGTAAHAVPEVPIRYGLHGEVATHNPLTIVFGEWTQMARDLRHSRSLRDALGLLFARPAAAAARAERLRGQPARPGGVAGASASPASQPFDARSA
jgi:sterol desaturase/sphingolipid hydroxylase (fatty acid hydroxylase superfamily)